MQQSQFGLSPQLANHAWHRGRNWPPLVNFPRLIKAHAYEEDDKVPVDCCGEPFTVNHATPYAFNGPPWTELAHWP